MKKLTIFLISILSAMFSFEQEVKVYENFSDFEFYLHKKNDTTYLVNFWATWCVPCVKELPAFQKIQDNYNEEKLKVLLVSIDMTDKLNSTLIPFIKKNKLTSKVVLLDDPHQNSWINKVNEKWEGAIPATLIYNQSKKKNYEQKFDYEELNEIVLHFIN